MFDLRTVVIAVSFILASIAVAAADGAQERSSQAPKTETAGEARPIRVVLPAPWQTAAPEAGSTLPLR